MSHHRSIFVGENMKQTFWIDLISLADSMLKFWEYGLPQPQFDRTHNGGFLSRSTRQVHAKILLEFNWMYLLLSVVSSRGRRSSRYIWPIINILNLWLSDNSSRFILYKKRLAFDIAKICPARFSTNMLLFCSSYFEVEKYVEHFSWRIMVHSTSHLPPCPRLICRHTRTLLFTAPIQWARFQ